MVNAQEYIERNFPRDAEDINVRDRNLEGYLDLSEYQNLKFITFLSNRELTGLKLCDSPRLSTISITNTKITDFSFLFNAPKINTVHLPKRDANLRSNIHEIAQLTRSLTQAHRTLLNEKDQQIQKLKKLNIQLDKLFQINSKKSYRQSLLAQLNPQNNLNLTFWLRELVSVQKKMVNSPSEIQPTVLESIKRELVELGVEEEENERLCELQREISELKKELEVEVREIHPTIS